MEYDAMFPIKLSEKTCATILLVACLIITAAFSVSIALEYGLTVTYVAREKIIGAAENIPIETTNVPLAIGIGAAVFAVGTSLSVLLSELYYSALTFYRQNIK